MKKLLFTILILFSFITNIFAEETIGYINGTEVNFRNKPSLNSKVISQLNRPEEIIILDIVVTSDIKYKYWYKIKTKENEIGYIYYLLVVTDPKLIGSDLNKSLKEVIFYDSKLGPIKFSNKLPITIKLLKKIFPEHKVTKGIGQGDSPDFYYFGVSKENKKINISSFIQNEDYYNTMIEMIVCRDFAGIVRRNYVEGEATTQDIFNFIEANTEQILRCIFDENIPAVKAIAKLFTEQA